MVCNSLEYAPEEEQRYPKPRLHSLALVALLEVRQKVVDAYGRGELSDNLESLLVKRWSGGRFIALILTAAIDMEARIKSSNPMRIQVGRDDTRM